MVAESPDIQGPGGRDIYDKIIEALDANGEMDDKTFRRLVLFALVDLGNGRRDNEHRKRGIIKIDERVKKLESQSILGLAHKHPKTAFVIGAFVFVFVISVIAYMDLWILLAEWLEVPLP